MIATAKPNFTTIGLPTFRLKRWLVARRRRRATIDLIHASPHLLRDIGVGYGQTAPRSR